MKNYQVSEKLLINLCKYFLLNIKDNQMEEDIKTELKIKMTKIENRRIFSEKLKN